MNAAGIGKLVPNMVLMGFKNDWMNDLDSIEGYLNVIHHGFNMHLAVGILKLKDGCDYSDVIGKLSFRCHSTSISISMYLPHSIKKWRNCLIFSFSSIETVTTHLLKKSTSFLDAQEF